MKEQALVYRGMTLLDLVGPLQAWSFLPGYEVQYVWHRPGTVHTDCGLGVQATHSFEDAWTDPDVLFVGGGAKSTLNIKSESYRLREKKKAGLLGSHVVPTTEEGITDASS